MYLSAEKLKSGALLAPMAGVADRSMRELCMEFGAIGCIGEMASSKGISMNDRKSSELLSLSDAERPAGVQIFGDVPEIMAKAIETCMKYSPDFIDINMGCPAPKVAGNGGGSALMKRPELAAEIVAQCVKVSPVPITVKMRAGWDAENINAPELAVLCEQAGAAAITVHGRTRKQMYAPPVDLDVDITWGIAFDDSMDDEMMITVIATGFEDKPKSAMYPEEQPKAEAPAAPAAQTEYVQTSIAQPAKPVAPEEPKKEDAPYIAKRPAEINPDDEFSIILDSFNR